MATSKLGYMCAIGLAEETTWGTKVAPSLFLPATSSVTLTKQLAQRYGIRKKRSKTKPVLVGWRLAGTITFEADPENMGKPLKWALGRQNPAVAAIGTGAYRHYFKLHSDTLSSFTLEEDKQLTAIESGGGKVNRLTITNTPGETTRVAMDCVFKADQAKVTATTPTYSTRQPFHYGQTANVVINGTAYTNIRDWEITIDNALITEKPTIDGGLYIKEPDVGQPTVSGRMTAYFDNLNALETFWNTIGATGPGSSLTAYQLSMSIQSTENILGSGKPYRFAIIMSAAVIEGGDVPVTDAGAQLTQTLTFTGYESGNGNLDDISIELDDAQLETY